MELKISIVKKGYWFYGGNNKQIISIIKQNWDFYFEEEYDEKPDLNQNGEAYYVIYGDYSDLNYANRSYTCFSETEAMNLAYNTIKEKIYWV